MKRSILWIAMALGVCFLLHSASAQQSTPKPAPSKRAKAAPAARTPAARTPAARRAPAARTPAARTPAARTPAARTPAVSKKVGLQDSLLKNLLASKIIRVCVRADVPPFGYFQGQLLTGYDIALAKELVAGLSIRYQSSIKIQWVVIRAKDRIPSLQQGSCDFVVAAFSKTAKRARLVSFSKVYHQTHKVVLKRSAPWKGDPIIAQVRTTTSAAFNVKNAIYSSFLTYSDILYTMRQQLIHYVITDAPIGRYMSRQSGSAYMVHKLLPQKELYSVGVSKKNTELLRELNLIVERLKSNGKLAYLQRTWLK